jgi:hypothetical protein
MSTDPSPRPPRPDLNVDQLAVEIGVSPRSVRNYVSKGHFRAYRVSGRTGLWFDLAEVKAAMLKIPGRKAKAGFGAYGPDAIIVDLPAQPIVVQRAPTDATR